MRGRARIEIEHHDENSFHTTYRVERYMEYAKEVERQLQRHMQEKDIPWELKTNPGPPKGCSPFWNCKGWFTTTKGEKVRYPRLGSFEVFVVVQPGFAPKISGLPDVLQVWSKLQSRKWPGPERLASSVAELLSAAVNGQEVGEEIREIKERVSQGPKVQPPLTSIHPPMFFGLTPRGGITTPVKVRVAGDRPRGGITTPVKVRVAGDRSRSILKNVEKKNRLGRTELHNAVCRGDETCVQQLLQNRAAVDAKDGSGRTPLHLASDAASEVGVKLIELLLEARATTDATDLSGLTPLNLACDSKYTEAVAVLQSAEGSSRVPEELAEDYGGTEVPCAGRQTPAVDDYGEDEFEDEEPVAVPAAVPAKVPGPAAGHAPMPAQLAAPSAASVSQPKELPQAAAPATQAQDIASDYGEDFESEAAPALPESRPASAAPKDPSPGPPPEPEKPPGRWSMDFTYTIGPEGSEGIFDGKVQLLDRHVYNSVSAAVNNLNDGLIVVPEGYCVVFSGSQQNYYLLWREDKEAEVFSLLGSSDQSAEPLTPTRYQSDKACGVARAAEDAARAMTAAMTAVLGAAKASQDSAVAKATTKGEPPALPAASRPAPAQPAKPAPKEPPALPPPSRPARDPAQPAKPAPKDQLNTQRAELSDYFAKRYLAGELYDGSCYSNSYVGELGTYKYKASDGDVMVWRHAFDLRAFGEQGEEVLTLYHYTDDLAFRNVGNLEQTAAQLFASLKDERAHFGKGLYATQHEPAVWASRLRILLNNYSNGDPFSPTPEEAQKRDAEWGNGRKSGHRAAFCIPLIVPRSIAYHIFERHTPDMAEKTVKDSAGQERPIKLGEDYLGQPTHRNRDVWVIRVETDGNVQDAAANADAVLDLLQLRLRKLRASAGEDVLMADCMFELARRLHGRARYGEAEELYRECLRICQAKLGEDHPDTLTCRNNLARLLQAQGHLVEAEPLYREALEKCQATLGEDHPQTLTYLNNLALLLKAQGHLAKPEPLFRKALEKSQAKLGEDHPQTLTYLNNLALLLKAQGHLAKAEPLYREALEKRRLKLGNQHPHTMGSIYNLAVLLKSMDKFEEAEELFREHLAAWKAKLGEDHPDTLNSINNLAAVLDDQEAEPLYREALEKSKAKLGEDHPDTLRSLSNLAELLEAQGHLAEAEPLYREALEKSPAKLGEDHPDTLNSINNLAAVLDDQEAEPLYREALEKSPGKAKLGEDHPDTLNSINNLAAVLDDQEAEPLYREALEKSPGKAKLGEDHPDTLSSLNNLALLLKAQGHLAEAEPLYREALEKSKAKLGEDHPDTLNSINNLAAVLDDQEAEPLYREALEKSPGKAKLGEDHPDTLNSINNLAAVLEAQEAEPLYREALEKSPGAQLQRFQRDFGQWIWRRLKLGNQHPDTMWSIYSLANLLKSMKKFEEAEELFREELAACNSPSMLSVSFSLRRCYDSRKMALLLFSEFSADLGGACQGIAVHGEHLQETVTSRSAEKWMRRPNCSVKANNCESEMVKALSFCDLLLLMGPSERS
ncbi:unnamed protein product [Cladocopium goreaui]|uniref:Uncharacterized protein n=1 Tax=Cladocopium goreaui TaxID=2562237 RepID=A0A9P1C1G5_9DINO|nr:unnamed protein product [Cladocopium goreaui]